MNHMKSYVFILSLVLILSGCAITVNIPVNRFDSPETTGKLGRVKVAASGGGTDEVTLTPDYTATPPNTTSPYLDTGVFARVTGGVGLLDNLDVELRNFSEFWAKYEIFGDSRLNAQAGNFALAVTVGAGYGQNSSTNSNTIRNLQGNVSQSEYWGDAALVLGYRLSPMFLFYGGPFARSTRYSGSYTLTPGTFASDGSFTASGPTPAATSFSGNVTSTGGNLGVELGSTLYQIRIEAAYANENSGTMNNGRLQVGAELAFNFGAH